MSDLQTQTAASPQAINSRAADWVIAKREHEWTDALQAELDAWLAQSPAHMVAYLRIDTAWSRADRLNALRPSATPPGVPRVKPMLARAAIAFAALLVVGVVAAPFVHLERGRENLFHHAWRPHHDCAERWLAGRTQHRYGDPHFRQERRRKVWLNRGEAYFDVRHDPVHPFLLSIGDHRVVDVGTKFTVRRDASQTRIAVAEGSVRFEPAASGKQLTLVRGDVLVATPQAVSVSKNPWKNCCGAWLAHGNL